MSNAWKRISLALLLTAGLASEFRPLATATAADEPESARPATDVLPMADQQIANFALRDFHGKLHSLAEDTESKLVVVIFVGCECPVARLTAPRLVALAKEFGPQGVAFLAINANSQDSLSEIAAFARLHAIEFPILKDVGNVVADRFGAERTPEVFVLDRQRVVRYRGRIDDQNLVGQHRARPTREDLKIALTELLANRPASVPRTVAAGCHIGRIPAHRRDGDVTYSQQISRLLQDRCVSCHRPGEIGPFSLTSYDEAVGWGETIREVVQQERMPPWLASGEHGRFANDARLSDSEKKLLFDWLDAGAPEGDRTQLPEPKVFPAGWQIPEPDKVIHISDKPVDVPAEGVVPYQFFTVDPGFKEDRWIKAAECRPGNRAVVHHIVVNFIPPGGRARIGLNGAMVAFAPGIPAVRLPAGLAMFVPAGSQILFQLHYTPNGAAQQDRSALGLVFADPSEVRQRVEGGGAVNLNFELAPGAGDVTVQSQHRFGRATQLVSLMPHMHLRGKSFRYEMQYPDGSREILLDVPRYDFNWQLRYELAEPKLLPAGSLMTCTAHFDNSADNPVNPDPTARVHWGDQTWDEMMIGYFGTLSADASAAPSGPLAEVVVRDDPESQRLARQLVASGLEVLGGEKRLRERPVLNFKTRGKVYLTQTPVAFLGDTTVDPTTTRLRMRVDSIAFKFGIVLDGQRGWLRLQDRVIDLPHEALDEQRERMHAETVALLYPVLKDPKYHLGLIEKARLGERVVDAIVVRHDGHREVRLFFDRESHLPVKTETEINENGKELAQETQLEAYAVVDGVWRPHRVVTRWDGVDRAVREMSDFHASAEAEKDAFARP